MGFTGEQVDAFPVVLHGRKPWVLRRGWRLQRTDRRALAFLPLDLNPAAPPSSRRLWPLLAAFGLDSRSPGPQQSRARACSCTPMGAEPLPPCCLHRRGFYGSLGSEWAACGPSWVCREGNVRPLALPLLLGPLPMSLFLLHPFFCVSQLLPLTSHQTRCCPGGFGKRFPARP